MGRPKKQKIRNRNIGLGITAIGATSFLLYLFVFGGITDLANIGETLFGTDDTTPPTPTPSFSLSIWEGVIWDELDPDEFTGVLYETNDLEDYNDFDVLKTFASGGVDLKVTDWDDQEKSILVLSLKSTAYPHDDDIFGEDRDVGARPYGERWYIINPTGSNDITMFQTPTTADIVILNSGTIATIDLSSANITYAVNFSVIAATNMSDLEYNARYVSGQDYSIEGELAPNILITFNASVALSDLSISGTDKSRVNDTTISYSWNILSPTPITLNGIWSDSAITDADLEIVNATLRFGESAI